MRYGVERLRAARLVAALGLAAQVLDEIFPQHYGPAAHTAADLAQDRASCPFRTSDRKGQFTQREGNLIDSETTIHGRYLEPRDDAAQD
jgi:hypothetical protein